MGEVKDGGQVDIIGIGISPSHGLKKGVVVNIDSTVESIKKAVQEAELMAGVEINSVFVGISGGHIKGINSRGVAAIKNREVGPADVARAIDGARAVNFPSDQQILHVLPQEFIIDDQDGIKDPLGMSGIPARCESPHHYRRCYGHSEHRQKLLARRSARERPRAPAAGIEQGRPYRRRAGARRCGRRYRRRHDGPGFFSRRQYVAHRGAAHRGQPLDERYRDRITDSRFGG